MTPTLEKLLTLTIALAKLPNESPEADAIRDEIDAPWRKTTPEERRIVQFLSANLLALPKVEGEPCPDVGLSPPLEPRPNHHFENMYKGQRYALPDGTKVELTGVYYTGGICDLVKGSYDAHNVESGRPLRVSGEALARAKPIQ